MLKYTNLEMAVGIYGLWELHEFTKGAKLRWKFNLIGPIRKTKIMEIGGIGGF